MPASMLLMCRVLTQHSSFKSLPWHLFSSQVWHTDVRFYCIKDSLGEPIAYFYLDPYCRPAEKQSGAWMGEVLSRSHVLAPPGATFRLPVAYMVCNQMPPVGDKPSLMTFREVTIVI